MRHINLFRVRGRDSLPAFEESSIAHSIRPGYNHLLGISFTLTSLLFCRKNQTCTWVLIVAKGCCRLGSPLQIRYGILNTKSVHAATVALASLQESCTPRLVDTADQSDRPQNFLCCLGTKIRPSTAIYSTWTCGNQLNINTDYNEW